MGTGRVRALDNRVTTGIVFFLVAALLSLGIPLSGTVSLSLHSGGPSSLRSVASEFKDSAALSRSSENPHGFSIGDLTSVRSSSEEPSWTNLTGPAAPPPLDFASLSYDQADHYMVAFGGQSASAYPTNYTWIFANGTWSNITGSAGQAPVARIAMALAYDPVDHYVLAYGGGDFSASCGTTRSTACNSTWAFYGGKWHVLPSVGLSPTVSMQFSMAFDGADSYVMGTDGWSTWKFVGGLWTEFCGTPSNCSNPRPPPPRLSGTVGYDAQDGYVLFFGEGFTWKFAGGNWTNISSTSGIPPSSRLYPTITDDASAGLVLLFGGLGGSGSTGYNPLNDTWMFQSGRWVNVTSVHSPSSRYAASAAYDAADSDVILFGGDTQSGSAGNLNDTWAWGSSPPIGELVLSVLPTQPLPGNAASFNVTFSGGVGPFTYSWRFGDGNASSLRSPTHAFGNEGYFHVGLWVNDSAGHFAASVIQVHVYISLSVTALRVTPSPAVFGQPVNFTSNTTGGTPPYTYSWSFGDGGTGGNLSVITHAYTTNGPFQVELTVTDTLGAIVHAFTNVSIRLQALAGATSSHGGSPLTVGFVGQAQGGAPPYQFDWNFGDGTTSTLENPQHTYNSTGLFDVVLTVVDSKENRSTSSLAVQVGGGSSGGISTFGWFGELVAGLVAAAGLASFWGANVLRQRFRRKEGERWIGELTSEGPPPEAEIVRPR